MAVSFDKIKNSSEVQSILYYNQIHLYIPSEPHKYMHFSKVNGSWYVIVETKNSVEFFLTLGKNEMIGNDYNKRPNYAEVVVGLFPMVNGQPDYNNKLVKPFNK
jgi:hypothetical protein